MNQVTTEYQSKAGHLALSLLGNPNCGKTTLFNLLTGVRQQVGNWPGVTVERKSGRLLAGRVEVELTDLPGLYSLNAGSIDEEVAHNYLVSGETDVVINLVDASNLERSLYLTSQLLEMNVQVVVGLNMMDVLEKLGLEIDAERLSLILGVPVVPLVAKKREGANHLLTEALKLGDQPARKPLAAVETEDRLEWIGRIAREVIVEARPAKIALIDKADHLLLHRFWGLPIFLLAMYMVFFISINLAAPFIDLIDGLAGALLVDGVGNLLRGLGTPDWLITLLADGVGGGVQTVLTFIPPIGLLFLTLSILEDSGYMARATVLLDGMVSKIGLPGKAVVPMIVGFGCSVPALMATRTLEEERDRRLTLGMVPFMSCGAKLPVYAMFSAAFFPFGAQNLVFGLYLAGILVAVGTGLILKTTVFVGKPNPLLIELPAYHVPSPASVLSNTWVRLKRFLLEAGKLIVVIVAALTVLNSVGTDGSFGHQDSESSMLAQTGKAITPIFYGMGITDENWPATVGIFTGIFAKEAIIGTLDSMYSSMERGNGEAATPEAVLDQVTAVLGDLPGGLAKAMGNFFNPLGMDLGKASDAASAAEELEVSHGSFGIMARYFDGPAGAFAYLLWVLLYAPCVAATAALRRETDGRWTIFTVVYMTGLAWSFSTLFYQFSRFGEHPQSSMGWIAAALTLVGLLVGFMLRFGRQVLAANFHAHDNFTCTTKGCGKCA
ncbi:MAG: ferrous iron transport protein B [bacterium]|nr:ferrous iron transport protein B [bacterium]